MTTTTSPAGASAAPRPAGPPPGRSPASWPLSAPHATRCGRRRRAHAHRHAAAVGDVRAQQRPYPEKATLQYFVAPLRGHRLPAAPAAVRHRRARADLRAGARPRPDPARPRLGHHRDRGGQRSLHHRRRRRPGCDHRRRRVGGLRGRRHAAGRRAGRARGAGGRGRAAAGLDVAVRPVGRAGRAGRGVRADAVRGGRDAHQRRHRGAANPYSGAVFLSFLAALGGGLRGPARVRPDDLGGRPSPSGTASSARWCCWSSRWRCR